MEEHNKRGPRERPLNTLGNQQKMTRVVTELKNRVDNLRMEANVDDEFMAKALGKLVHPSTTLLKQAWESEWLKNQEPSKEFTEERLERILLSKMESLAPNNCWTTIRDVGEISELPSVKTLTRIKEKLNTKLKDELKLQSNANLVSCSIGVEECVKFILRLHLNAFGQNSFPADVTMKFSFDGRPIEGRHEVVIGLVPIGTKFPEQSGYSSFPIEILQGTEKQAKDNIKKIATALVDIEKHGVNWMEDNLFKYDGSFNIKVVICSDLVAIWRACNLKWKKGKVYQFCPKCTRTCAQIGDVKDIGVDEMRDLLPELNIPAKNYIYCSLHAGMRITERIIEAIVTPLSNSKRKKFADEARVRGVRVELSKKTKVDVSVQGNTVKDFFYDPKAIDKTKGKLIYQRLKDLPNDVKPATPEIEFLVDWYMESNSSKDGSISKKRSQEYITMLLNSWAAVYLIIARDQDLDLFDIIALKVALDSMQQLFLKLFVDFMTPYLHLLFCHTIEIIDKHKSIGKYSQQGFEQANSLHRSTEVRASNHGGGRGKRSVSEQVMNHIWGRLYLLDKYQLLTKVKKIHHRVWKKKADTVEESSEAESIDSLSGAELVSTEQKKGKKRKRYPDAITKGNKRRRLESKEPLVQLEKEERSYSESEEEDNNNNANNNNNMDDN